MSTSCSFLKMCAFAVSFANLSVGLAIFSYGIVWLIKYLRGEFTIGYLIVAFQLAAFLIFAGTVLLMGIIQAKEKHVSLYLLLSSLIWFVITNLAVFYMIFRRPITGDMNIANNTAVTTTVMPTEAMSTTGPPEVLQEDLPVEKTVGFSIGLILFWCGQIGVYKFHQQVIENNMINAGESYLNSAMHNEEKAFRNQ